MESETGKATCSSDVWALGIILHWPLFEEAPFKSQNSSNLSNKALTNNYSPLKGGAGWHSHQKYRYAIQNRKVIHQGSACLGGKKGQRVVLEADRQEGKRTLKLSQDEETQPVFFTETTQFSHQSGLPSSQMLIHLAFHDSLLLEGWI
ncbi:hypothetical protein BLNAU_13067 [Blattamonas nauphoetae]|uniref:Uncharacterized protein n=1 Tax=Blattamonas nauphoetae TaxID=2049346 RepID=A0ABQ9XHQ0_9EUKA|nr:hypothetical protein BLNAU_13067 [Blattamonas nauphoetae]